VCELYSEKRFAQEEEEKVTIGCVGIYVNDVYAMTAHDSCMCTRQLHGLLQEIYTNICLKYQEYLILDKLSPAAQTGLHRR
jgi:hypothetical protein